MPRAHNSTRPGGDRGSQGPYKVPPRHGKARCETGPLDCPCITVMGFEYEHGKAEKKCIRYDVKAVVPKALLAHTAIITSKALGMADVECLYYNGDIGTDKLTCLRCGHKSTKKSNALSHSFCKRKHLKCIVCETGFATVSEFQKHCRTDSHAGKTKGWTFVEDGQKELPLEPEGAIPDADPADLAFLSEVSTESLEQELGASQQSQELEIPLSQEPEVPLSQEPEVPLVQPWMIELQNLLASSNEDLLNTIERGRLAMLVLSHRQQQQQHDIFVQSFFGTDSGSDDY